MIGNVFKVIYNFFFAFLKVSDAEVYPPPLTAEEEQKCFVRMKNGDMYAREKLIRHNSQKILYSFKKSR